MHMVAIFESLNHHDERRCVESEWSPLSGSTPRPREEVSEAEIPTRCGAVAAAARREMDEHHRRAPALRACRFDCLRNLAFGERYGTRQLTVRSK
jgi:hypothetical protein